MTGNASEAQAPEWKEKAEKRWRFPRNETFPDDMELTPAMEEFANSLHVSPKAEFAAFRYHAKRNRVQHKDWSRAFANWCRNAAKFEQNRARWRDPTETAAIMKMFDQTIKELADKCSIPSA